MKAILFDFDGVLVQSMEDHYLGWKKALKKFGIDMSPEELYMMEGQGVRAIANEISRKYNLTIEDTTAIIKNKQKYYNKIKKIPLLSESFGCSHLGQRKKVTPWDCYRWRSPARFGYLGEFWYSGFVQRHYHQ